MMSGSTPISPGSDPLYNLSSSSPKIGRAGDRAVDGSQKPKSSNPDLFLAPADLIDEKALQDRSIDVASKDFLIKRWNTPGYGERFMGLVRKRSDSDVAAARAQRGPEADLLADEALRDPVFSNRLDPEDSFLKLAKDMGNLLLDAAYDSLKEVRNAFGATVALHEIWSKKKAAAQVPEALAPVVAQYKPLIETSRIAFAVTQAAGDFMRAADENNLSKTTLQKIIKPFLKSDVRIQLEKNDSAKMALESLIAASKSSDALDLDLLEVHFQTLLNGLQQEFGLINEVQTKALTQVWAEKKAEALGEAFDSLLGDEFLSKDSLNSAELQLLLEPFLKDALLLNWLLQQKNLPKELKIFLENKITEQVTGKDMLDKAKEAISNLLSDDLEELSVTVDALKAFLENAKEVQVNVLKELMDEGSMAADSLSADAKVFVDLCLKELEPILNKALDSNLVKTLLSEVVGTTRRIFLSIAWLLISVIQGVASVFQFLTLLKVPGCEAITAGVMVVSTLLQSVFMTEAAKKDTSTFSTGLARSGLANYKLSDIQKSADLADFERVEHKAVIKGVLRHQSLTGKGLEVAGTVLEWAVAGSALGLVIVKGLVVLGVLGAAALSFATPFAWGVMAVSTTVFGFYCAYVAGRWLFRAVQSYRYDQCLKAAVDMGDVPLEEGGASWGDVPSLYKTLYKKAVDIKKLDPVAAHEYVKRRAFIGLLKYDTPLLLETLYQRLKSGDRNTQEILRDLGNMEESEIESLIRGAQSGDEGVRDDAFELLSRALGLG